LDISKVAYEIHKRFYENKQHYFELRPDEVLRQRNEFGLAGASSEEIHEAFRRLKRRDVIDSPEGSDRYTITNTGKKTPPEYLVWEEEKKYYDRVQERIKKRKWWARGARVCFLLFLVVFFFATVSSGFPDYVRYSLFSFVGLFALLGVISSRRSGSPPADEDAIFAKMWKAYESLSSYESKRRNGDLKECLGMLGDVVKMLRTDGFSNWALVKENIFGAFQKLARYLREIIIPSLQKGEVEKAGPAIVRIGTLFMERDIPGLTGFVESLDVRVPMAKRRIPSWSELKAKPTTRFALAAIGLSVLTVLGFYGVSILQNQPLTSYAHLMFASWITVVGAAAVKILL